MPVIDITNPAIIRFLIENYEKTARLRMKWNVLHAERLKQTASFTREEKGYTEKDIAQESMVTGMTAITRDHISGYRNKLKTPDRYGMAIPSTSRVDAKEVTIKPTMKPVDPEHKKIFYKDVPEFGREVYLKTRSKIPPPEKYYFDESTAWTYGWSLGESSLNKYIPVHGKVTCLTEGSKSRTGPQPDPPHYQDPSSGSIACPF